MSAPMRRVAVSFPPRGAAGHGAFTVDRPVPDPSPYSTQRIGEILVSLGALKPEALRTALAAQANRPGPPLGAILVSEGMIDAGTLAAGLALQGGAPRVAVVAEALAAERVDRLGADRCLRHRLAPLGSDRDGTVTVATSRPDGFEAARPEMEAAWGPVTMAVTDEAALLAALTGLRGKWLVNRAEARPERSLSVRGWSPGGIARTMATGLSLFLAALVAAPFAVMSALLWAAAAVLAITTLLRLGAMWTHVRGGGPRPEAPDLPREDLPRISVLVPLLSEAEITDHLVAHLARIDYPADRLDVLLVTEADDAATDGALARSHNALPPHCRRVVVPAGRIRTKPRALNYALDFARGDIVGVWDAEDAPEPDQLQRIAAAFAAAPPEVVCLQGRLDFYNPRQNWLARCFALDYAAWFRIVLPGLSRLGLAIPLGGTTLFFRRAALEAMGRWDAHNVTEDADLGIRLARFGWRAEIVATTTYEEANCRPMAWIRQRTRWIKGYALTWAVHMRRPQRLWREIGTKRFLGFQAMFAGTVFMFLAAPLLWSLLLLPLGFGHPLTDRLAGPSLAALVGLFVVSEIVNLGVAALAVGKPKDRWLIKWVPLLMLYFPLGTLAAFRALVDIAIAPFFWDKTRHGLSREAVRPLFRSRRSA